ncbi:MAG: hypothetical protein ACYC8T_17810 [Myxococcaceae bacterium]
MATVRRFDGALDIFQATLPGATSYFNQAGKRQSLELVPATLPALDAYWLTEEDGTVRVFEKKVLRYIEPPGAPSLRHEVCYADSTSLSSCQCGASFATIAGTPLPCELKPSAGPPVFLNWQTVGGNDVLASLTWSSPTGERIASYEYDPTTGDLRFAKLTKSPGPPILYETWEYRYDTAHHLTHVIDPAGVVVEEHSWTGTGASARVTASKTPTESFALTYDAVNKRTAVSEANNGTSYTLGYNTANEPATVTGTCGCATHVAGYTWRRATGVHAVSAVQHSDGSFTSYTIDSRGDAAKEVVGDGDGDATTVPTGALERSMSYHPAFRALLSVTRPGLLSATPTHTIYDYQDPNLTPAPPDPFCGTSACATPDKYNLTANMTGLLRREIRKGSTPCGST